MSKEYDAYLKSHIDAVKTGYLWIREHIEVGELKSVLPGVFGSENEKKMLERLRNHDASKYGLEEYPAYDDYFYGHDGVQTISGPSEEVKNAFNYAWLHHIHANPHHWQYWVLVNDDQDEGVKALEMPDMDILEMICDWWSFSWRTGNLYEIFNWWNNHKNYIVFGVSTSEKVEKLLSLLRWTIWNEVGDSEDSRYLEGGESDE